MQLEKPVDWKIDKTYFSNLYKEWWQGKISQKRQQKDIEREKSQDTMMEWMTMGGEEKSVVTPVFLTWVLLGKREKNLDSLLPLSHPF